MRTLSEPAVYKLPDAPMHKAVIGVSPGWVNPRFAVPASVFPDDVRILTAFAWLERGSQTLINAPHAENSRFDDLSYSMATTGPG